MELLIVGAGAMGRWFASVIDGSITFVDIDESAAEEAVSAHGGRALSLPTEETFDIVCVAVPLLAAEEAIEAHADLATKAILDLTGRMGEPVATMAEEAPDLERVSLHPLFAPSNAPGRIAVVEAASGPTTTAVLDQLRSSGNELIQTTPSTHDRAMNTIQARAHTAILAFALAAQPVPEDFGTPVYDGLIELVTEVTGGNPHVYADIQAVFDGAEDVATAAKQLADADRETFEQLYRDAGS